jgi:hypothetical protein
MPFDHLDYLTRNPTAYDTWVAALKAAAASIWIDTDHILDRHVVWANRVFAEGEDSGDLFLLPTWVGNPPQQATAAADIDALVRDCVANFATCIADTASVLCQHTYGGQIGLSDAGDALSSVRFSIDTNGMSTASDWQNAYVSTSYPC